jgi:WD40 repeat protein
VYILIFLKVVAVLFFPFVAIASFQRVSPENISNTANLGIPRAAHTATLLPNGKVLIAGGCISNGCENNVTSSAELFDPNNQIFSPIANMMISRVGHQAVPLKSGLVLILGGWTGQNTTAKAEIFDSVTEKFVTIGNMLEARDGFTATRLNDGRVLIAGGYYGAIQRLDSAEIFDPATNQFTTVGSMGSPRMAHSAALLSDGRVLIVGGSKSRGAVVSSAEVFDPYNNSFSVLSNMNSPRHKQAAVTLKDGRVLIVGGADSNDFTGQYASTEIFSPKTNRFVSSSSMNAARFKISDSVLQLENAQVLIAGSDRQAEVFDPRSNSFRVVQGEFDAERAYMTATRLQDGRVLIVGGYDSSIRVTNRAWLYSAK